MHNMITTLTLNPAIDRTLIVDNFKVNSVNKVHHVSVLAGGKGINVSRTVRFLGEETVALGIVGGSTGQELMLLLDEEGIRHDFIHIDGKTRTNIKLVDNQNNTCTDMNEPGASIDAETLIKLNQKITDYAVKSDLFVLSGSLPAGVPSHYCRSLITQLNKMGIRTIFDGSGDCLREGINASPYLIKPNIHELCELLGIRTLTESAKIIAACHDLLKQTNIPNICVSCGSAGLVWVSKDKTIQAVPPALTSKNTVGAGDIVVGCLAAGLRAGVSQTDVLRHACAVSAASVTLSGTGLPSKAQIADIYRQVKIL